MRLPGLRRVLSALVLLATVTAVVAAGLWWHWSRSALPRVEGRGSLHGLTGPVLVRRDGLGVPHIHGGSMLDVIRAQGYVTAQDRLWQMDLLRRRALGELAEAFGEGALDADKEVRTLGLGAAAREALTLLPPDAVTLLEAYAAGANAFIDARHEALPVEFRLLRYTPRPWTPVDSLAVSKLLALDLANGWGGEAFRATIGDRLPPDVQALLYPTTFPNDRILFGSDRTKAAERSGEAEDVAQGSNNWVVSGAHTATGKPLLANDPHLQLGVPSIWAAIHLSAGDFDVAGVALPGTPGVTLGRNRHLAWGATNVHDDSADLYVEAFDPQDHDRYRLPDGRWEHVRTRDEPIRVRSGPLSSSYRTSPHQVRLTRHGPLVDIRGVTYALRWTSIEKVVELPAFLAMNRATTWEEFREAVRQFPGPSQNFVCADVDGHIAWYSAGRLPVRRAGDGSRPYSGDSADGDWLGFVPFDELPHLVDPPAGRIVTANNRLVGSDYPYTVSRGGIAPYRAQVLFEALEAREGWTTDDMTALQGERLSIPHRDLALVLLEAAARHPGDAAWDEIKHEMSGWNGRLEPASHAAALAVATFRAVGERVLSPRLKPHPGADRLRRRTAPIHRLILDQSKAWLPAGDHDWDTVLRAAWSDATAELTRSLGGDRARWTYGAINRMAARHPLTRAVPALGLLLSPPDREMGGGTVTPNVLALSDDGAAEGPSMRFVANLADADDTRLVNFMGQSGHPASPHYADQLEAWTRVESIRLPFSPDAVARETRQTLTLFPEGDSRPGRRGHRGRN